MPMDEHSPNPPKPQRDLTSLEYIVLGLIGMEAQSGYSIINYFEEGQYSWSASPGSIYPMLTRLEKSGVIEGVLEVESETRQRKIYHLTRLGETLLDDWLRDIPKMRPFYEQRELAMLRFQFMETRFNIAQIVEWLDGYLDTVRLTDAHRLSYQDALLQALTDAGKGSIHKQLLMEATMMELNMLRTWLEMARARLTAVGIQTGEYRAVKVE
jgi:DNA-binding PadR family transcriptional regulator